MANFHSGMLVVPKRLCVVASLLLAFVLAGCGGSNPYKVMQRKGEFGTVPVRVIVTDFEDKRPFNQESNVGVTMIPIFGLWGGYSQDRHDDFYGITPFKRTMAKQLADRLKEAGTFQDVKYVPPDAIPPKGDYDVQIQGTLLKVQSRGSFTRYGVSILGDILWELGLPKFNRRWVIDAEYRLVDGYTGEQIGDTKQVSAATSRKWFTTYFNRGRASDLERKTDAAYDGMIDWVWTSQPKADDVYWAELKKKGELKLAEERLAAEQAKKGTPPTFTFLSPTANSALRGASADVRWAITAPGGLKSVVLAANNSPVTLPVDVLSMQNAETAPKSIAAQDVRVPLKLGANKVEAMVIDHRGNETRAAIELTRLPSELTPARRFALVIGAGSAEAKASTDDIKGVLVDPLLGQFPEKNVQVVALDTLTKDELAKAAKQFGAEPLSGNLAFIFLATKGDWETLKLGDGSVTLNELVSTITSSLATKEVVLIADINWTGKSSQGDLASRLPELPATWAFFTSQPNGEATVVKGGKLLTAESLVETFRGKDGSTARLTLERLFDALIVSIEDGSNGQLKPAVSGRFNPSISVVERE
ncbi:hypothetical protein IT570_06680 [Candidatus Sumerlaeota bacterium]|nr:hypothetical protein [Candidatus Sumerlaeota bacterium]